MYLSGSDLPKVKSFLFSYLPKGNDLESISFLGNNLSFSEILVEFERIGLFIINFLFEL